MVRDKVVVVTGAGGGIGREIAAAMAADGAKVVVNDIGAIAAFFALSNRMANMTAMRPNDEFYLLGRLPREKKA